MRRNSFAAKNHKQNPIGEVREDIKYHIVDYVGVYNFHNKPFPGFLRISFRHNTFLYTSFLRSSFFFKSATRTRKFGSIFIENGIAYNAQHDFSWIVVLWPV